MSNYLEDYVSVQDRLKEFINAYLHYRIKTHVLEESLTPSCDVYIVKCSCPGLKLMLRLGQRDLEQRIENKSNMLWSLPEHGRFGATLLISLASLQSQTQRLANQYDD
jgi:hypothetical protein